MGSKPWLLQGVIQTSGEDQKDGTGWQSMPAGDEDRFVMAIGLDGVIALERVILRKTAVSCTSTAAPAFDRPRAVR
jgi:hypothetical protein